MAMRAKRALARDGIRVEVTKQTAREDGGCRYAIRVTNADLLRVTLVLREEGIPYRMSN